MTCEIWNNTATWELQFADINQNYLDRNLIDW